MESPYRAIPISRHSPTQEVIGESISYLLRGTGVLPLGVTELEPLKGDDTQSSTSTLFLRKGSAETPAGRIIWLLDEKNQVAVPATVSNPSLGSIATTVGGVKS